MAGATSLEAVKRKIRFLQEQADGAEERAERLQKELLAERKTREQVSMFTARAAAGPACQNVKMSASSSCLPFLGCAPLTEQPELMHSQKAEFLS